MTATTDPRPEADTDAPDPAQPRSCDLLRIHLIACVPMRMAVLDQKGGPDDVDRDYAQRFAQTIAERGDVLLFGGDVGEPCRVPSGRIVNGLVHALAVLAFQPGGIRMGTLHWETRP